jgi:hypothetical protein
LSREQFFPRRWLTRHLRWIRRAAGGIVAKYAAGVRIR